jgi:hypothetical protein
MIVAIAEERWLVAWHLLSLDRVKPFFRDLWIRFDDEEVFVAELRTSIEAALESREYYRTPGRLHHRLAQWVINNYGEEGYGYLREWVLHILIDGGPDRKTEAVWSSLVQHLGRKCPTADGRVATKLGDLRRFLNERDDDLAARMVAPGSAQLSAWDGRVLPVYSSNLKAVDTKISLIASYNSLLLGWGERCADLSYDQLLDLDRIARSVAADLGWREADIPFPGNWRFDLTDLIRAASAEDVTRRIPRYI